MTAEARAAHGIESLPDSLGSALTALEADSVILDALGSHTAGQYINGKRREWEEYRSQVSQWELEKYLVAY
jgi:glutamine synthetase